jgi:type VI secretion system protein ImpA
MPILDIDRLLAPLPGEKPCGEDLSYDNAFQALERDIEGTPERQMGGTILPAEDPDWRDIQARALELFSRTRDLRLGAFLTRALLRQFGLEGLAEGLALVSGLVQQHWAQLYPELDPDDPAQEQRVNILGGLKHAQTMLAHVRTAPIVVFKGLGAFSERDLAIATGELEPPKGLTEVPKLQTIEAAFARVEIDALRASNAAVESAIGHAEAIEQTVGEAVGLTSGPNLTELKTQLTRIRKILADRLAKRVGGSDGEVAGEDSGDVGGGEGSSGGGALSGSIRSRDDVVRAMDKIIEYYERNEPSSPIPILMRRSQRLVRMDFADLIRDIAPDAMGQVDLLRGRTDPALNGDGSGGDSGSGGA